MDNILTKYQNLTPEFQREVDDFIDFVAARSSKRKSFNMKAWKKTIKGVSVWSSKDIQNLKEHSKGLSSWKAPKW